MTIAKKIFGAALKEILDLPEDPRNLDVLTYVDSQLRYNDFIIYLEKISGNYEIKISDLNKVGDYISDDWRNYNRTHASLLISEHSRINQALIVLSKYVSKAAAEFKVELSPNMILMPSVAEDVTKFKLHELALADDGSVIDVLKCLDEALKNRTLYLRHTSPPYRLLSMDERELIINHSKESLAYYRAILTYVVHDDPAKKDEHELLHNDVIEIRNKFVTAIKGTDYQVMTTFGEAGDKRLANKILEKINTANELADLMMMKIHPSQWQLFLNKMSSEQLARVMLENDSFSNAVQRRTNYFGDATHDRIMLLCFSEICKQEIMNQRDVTLLQRWLPNFVSNSLGSYSFADRLGGILLLQKFLLSNEPFSNLHRFCKQHAKKPEFYDAIFSLFSSSDILAQQLLQLADPNYLKPPRPLLPSWLNLKLP